jgi:hypothetical protein
MADEVGVSVDKIIRSGFTMYTRNLHRRQDRKLSYISKSIADYQGGCGYLDIITFYHHAGLIAAAVQDFPLAVELFSIVSLPLSNNG